MDLDYFIMLQFLSYFLSTFLAPLQQARLALCRATNQAHQNSTFIFNIRKKISLYQESESEGYTISTYTKPQPGSQSSHLG